MKQDTIQIVICKCNHVGDSKEVQIHITAEEAFLVLVMLSTQNVYISI